MSKHKVWFTNVRGSYLPCSWQGWLSYVPYLVYTVSVLVFVIKRDDTFWLALFTVIPNWVAVSIIMTWIARSKSL